MCDTHLTPDGLRCVLPAHTGGHRYESAWCADRHDEKETDQ